MFVTKAIEGVTNSTVNILGPGQYGSCFADNILK